MTKLKILTFLAGSLGWLNSLADTRLLDCQEYKYSRSSYACHQTQLKLNQQNNIPAAISLIFGKQKLKQDRRINIITELQNGLTSLHIHTGGKHYRGISIFAGPDKQTGLKPIHAGTHIFSKPLSGTFSTQLRIDQPSLITVVLLSNNRLYYNEVKHNIPHLKQPEAALARCENTSHQQLKHIAPRIYPGRQLQSFFANLHGSNIIRLQASRYQIQTPTGQHCHAPVTQASLIKNRQIFSRSWLGPYQQQETSISFRLGKITLQDKLTLKWSDTSNNSYQLGGKLIELATQNSMLYWACHNLELRLFKNLLLQRKGQHPVEGQLSACLTRQHRLTMLQSLLSTGYDIETPDHLGRSLLINSVLNNNEETTNWLLNNGANPNSIANNGQTALGHAVQSNLVDTGLFQSLLEFGANPLAAHSIQASPLLHSLQMDKRKLLNSLVPYLSSRDIYSSKIKTHWFVQHPDTLAKLFQRGLSPDQQDESARNLLNSLARIKLNDSPISEQHYHQLTDLLLQHKADVDLPDNEQHSALTASIQTGNIDMLKKIAGHSNRIDHCDQQQLTPLMQTLSTPQALESINILLANGANPDQTCQPRQDKLVIQATRLADEQTALAIVRLLHEQGADMHALTTRNKNLMDIAVAANRQSLINYLTQVGIQPAQNTSLASYSYALCNSTNPTVEFTDLGNNTRTISLAGAQATVLHFWSDQCKPCKRQFESWLNEHADLVQQGFAIHYIAVSNNPTAVQTWFDYQPPDVSLLLDTDKQASKGFRLTMVPSTLVIDNQGCIAYKQNGLRNWQPGELSEQILQSLTNTGQTETQASFSH